jgi:hypothetical protein
MSVVIIIYSPIGSNEKIDKAAIRILADNQTPCGELAKHLVMPKEQIASLVHSETEQTVNHELLS